MLTPEEIIIEELENCARLYGIAICVLNYDAATEEFTATVIPPEDFYMVNKSELN